MIRDGEIGNLQKITITLHAGWGSAVNSVSAVDRMSCWYVDVLNRIIGAYPSASSFWTAAAIRAACSL